MAPNDFGARLWTAVRNPWSVLTSVFGGALASAVGTSTTVSVGAAFVMLATAATVDAVTTRRDDRPAKLRHGTRQQELLTLLDGHVRSLRELSGTTLPSAVQMRAADALAAADAARPAVLRVGSAIDALDEAISAARRLAGHGEHATEAIRETIVRLNVRRGVLFDRLAAAVDEIATVYAGLLELSATARTIGVAVDDCEMSAVSTSVALMQMAFAELEADAAHLPVDERR